MSRDSGTDSGANSKTREERAAIQAIDADVTRDGLVVHFSDETSTLFTHRFLYEARSHQDNLPLADRGVPVPGSPIAEALGEEG